MRKKSFINTTDYVTLPKANRGCLTKVMKKRDTGEKCNAISSFWKTGVGSLNYNSKMELQ